MRYTLSLAALGAYATTTLAASVDSPDVVTPNQTTFATVTAATPVEGVETLTADDQYVAGSMPIVTKTTIVANPTAINFDMHECLAYASLQFCLGARHKHDDLPVPEPTNAGYCYHHEGATSYDYVLTGTGPWAGPNGADIEEAVRDVGFNKVSKWHFAGNSSGIDAWRATWRSVIGTRKRMDKHLRRIPGAPKGFTCKSREPKADGIKAAGLPEEGQKLLGEGAAEFGGEE